MKPVLFDLMVLFTVMPPSGLALGSRTPLAVSWNGAFQPVTSGRALPEEGDASDHEVLHALVGDREHLGATLRGWNVVLYGQSVSTIESRSVTTSVSA